MLKKTLLVTCVGILLATQNAQAGDAAQTGALGGAAGGAILGQAIGRNTTGTLLGTAIGGVLGYMVGNEMEKDQGRMVQTYSSPPRMVRQYEEESSADCREMEVLAMVDGRPERVYGTACYENGAWVLQDSGRVVKQTVIIDRNRHEPPRWGHRRGHDRDHWRSGHYYKNRQCDNTRIIFR